MRKILCSLMIGALLLAGGGALITAKTSMRAAFAEENVAAFTDTITEGHNRPRQSRPRRRRNARPRATRTTCRAGKDCYGCDYDRE